MLFAALTGGNKRATSGAGSPIAGEFRAQSVKTLLCRTAIERAVKEAVKKAAGYGSVAHF